MRLPWTSPGTTGGSWFKSRLERRFAAELLPHADALYGFALKLSRSPADAEDLVQDTLLKAYSALERTPADSHYKGWLFTILRNTWLSRMRRDGRIELYAEPPEPPVGGPPPPPIDAPFDDVVQAALARLPEPQRSAVLLCDVEELPYDEIARVLGCPIGTVRSRIFHGRRQLRAILETYARDQGVLRHGVQTLSSG